MKKQVLVPLDGSKLAEMILPHAVAYARIKDYGLALIHVVAPPAALDSNAWGVTPAEEMWEGLGNSGGLLSAGAKWPVADSELARSEELEIPVQVNGKLRSRLITSPEVSEAELKAAALADDKVKALIDGREIVKVVVVPKRLVNVVIR